jgi:hypothetical protein
VTWTVERDYRQFQPLRTVFSHCLGGLRCLMLVRTADHEPVAGVTIGMVGLVGIGYNRCV